MTSTGFESSFGWRTLAVTLLLCGSPCSAAELTAESIAAIREVSEPDISANGNRVAYTVDSEETVGRSKDIWVVHTDEDAEPEPLIRNEGADFSPAWSPDGKKLAFLSDGASVTESERGLYVAEADGTGQRRLSPEALKVRKFEWSTGGERIAFVADGLWVVDVNGGRLCRAGGAGENVLDLTWSPDGESIAVNDDNQLAVIDAETGERTATLADDVSKPWSRRMIFDWSPDGRRILYAELASEDVSPAGIGFWMSVVAATGGQARPLLKDHPGTVTQAMWAPDSEHVLAQSFQGTASSILRVEADSGDVSVVVDGIFEEKSFSIDDSGTRFAFLSSTHDSPVDVWFRDSRQPPRRLTNVNDGIRRLEHGEVRELQWEDAQGRRLYGILVLPVGYDPGRRYPAVVQLHGGPHFAWWQGWLGSWHDWAQLLAANGYAVFLPNPRGSTGQGLAFSLSNVNDIAHGPLDDVMRGVDHVVDIGVADPERLGIGGWSYGGFLTAWAITQTDRFKAAIVGAGISRLTKRSDMLLKEYYGNIAIRKRYARLAEISPNNFLEQVSTPTLVVHGKKDAKISYRQGVELHDGLEELGVETKLVLYEEEGHGIGGLQNRTDMLKNVLSWYERHLKSQTR